MYDRRRDSCLDDKASHRASPANILSLLSPLHGTLPACLDGVQLDTVTLVQAGVSGSTFASEERHRWSNTEFPARIDAMKAYFWLRPFLMFIVPVAPSIAFAQQGNRILHVMNSDGTGLRPLVVETDYNRQGSPEWSPDGKRIAFDAWRRSPSGQRLSSTKMFIVTVDGSDLKEIGDGAMPSFSADGKRIGFCRGRPNPGVWTMDIGGTNKQLVDEAGWAARWSPDGQKIAYTVRNGNGANIVVHDVETGRRTIVLTGEHRARYTRIRWSFGWSPDNRRLCFCGDRGPDISEATVVAVDGSDEHFQVLLIGKMAAKLSWHPNGRLILLSMTDPMLKIQQLFTVDLTKKGHVRPFVGQPRNRSNSIGTWSPDGTQIVFASRRMPN